MKRRRVNAVKFPRRKASVFLDDNLMDQVVAEAHSRQVSQQSLLESTIRDRYSPERKEENEAIIARRLSKIDTKLQVMERQIEVIAESLALYVRMWLTRTSEIPEEERDAAVLQAQARYDRYLKSLGKQLMSKETIFGALPKEVFLKGEDSSNNKESR